jgi:hypothetical protein
LCNELLQLIPNLGNGETSVDCFYLCDEELLVPVQGDGQRGISPGFGWSMANGRTSTLTVFRPAVGLKGGNCEIGARMYNVFCD